MVLLSVVIMARTLELFRLLPTIKHWKKNPISFKLRNKVVGLVFGRKLKYRKDTKGGKIGSEDLVAACFPRGGFLAAEILSWQGRVFISERKRSFCSDKF